MNMITRGSLVYAALTLGLISLWVAAVELLTEPGDTVGFLTITGIVCAIAFPLEAWFRHRDDLSKTRTNPRTFVGNITGLVAALILVFVLDWEGYGVYFEGAALGTVIGLLIGLIVQRRRIKGYRPQDVFK